LCYIDNKGAVCRCFNWRDGARTMVKDETKNSFLIMELLDNRLEDAMEWGAIEFLRRVQVKKAFIPMHLNGPLWTPSVYFKALFGDVPVWEPQKEGDECIF